MSEFLSKVNQEQLKHNRYGETGRIIFEEIKVPVKEGSKKMMLRPQRWDAVFAPLVQKSEECLKKQEQEEREFEPDQDSRQLQELVGADGPKVEGVNDERLNNEQAKPAPITYTDCLKLIEGTDESVFKAFDPFACRQLQLKKIFVIYNPSSGKRIDQKKFIEKTLQDANIEFEIKTSERYMHAMEIAKTFEIDNFDVLVAVGGDGTVHEVFNGLLCREDRKSIPLAVLPNGTGNDFASSFGNNTVQEGLNQLLKAQAVKVDVVDFVFDHQSRDELEKDEKFDQKCRYMILNNGFGFVAKVNAGAQKYKKCCGKKAYDISAMCNLCCLDADKMDIEIDGHLAYNHYVTSFCMTANTKFMGGGMVHCGISQLNDGLMEMVITQTGLTRGQLLALIDDMTKRNGVANYKKNVETWRGKNFKWTMHPMTEKQKGKHFLLIIDGENFFFESYAKATVLPSKIEVLCDFDALVRNQKIFNE